MEELLQEIRTLPNILGSFVFVEGLGIAASDLPKVLRNKDLDTLGRSINRIFALNQTSDVDVINIEIEYDEAKIFTKPIDETSVILVIGEPSSNPSMVKLTTSMLTSELKNAIDTARLTSILPEIADPNLEDLLPKDHETISLPIETVATAPPPLEQPKPASEPIDPAVLLEKGPLAEPLRRIEDALAKAIGPFARIIMRENIEKWAKSGAANNERLRELATLLTAEIDNDKLEKQFNNEISSLFS